MFQMTNQNFIFEDHDLVLQGLPTFDQSLMCTNILHNYICMHVDRLKSMVSPNYIICRLMLICIFSVSSVLICLVRNGSPGSTTD